MNLTKNFTLEEMTKSETALRYDIDNTPNEQEISSMKLLAEKVLQPVRDHFGKGVKVNSGFRNQDVNQKVGGSRNSDHTRGKPVTSKSLASPTLNSQSGSRTTLSSTN
jgi:zinc D-Ala-D-Ala carboxypeptidase